MRRLARLVKARHRNDGQVTGREEDQIRTSILQIPSLVSQRQEEGGFLKELVSQERYAQQVDGKQSYRYRFSVSGRRSKSRVCVLVVCVVCAIHSSFIILIVDDGIRRSKKRKKRELFYFFNLIFDHVDRASGISLTKGENDHFLFGHPAGRLTAGQALWIN